MDTEAFLNHILPSTGYYCLFSLKGKSPFPRQKFFSDIKSLAADAVNQSNAGYDVYQAMGAFTESTAEDKRFERKQEFVHAMRSFYVDIDCGVDKKGNVKPFTTWTEGLKSLKDWVKLHNIPVPTIIKSGGGLHCYWVLDQDITPQQWKPVAEALKAAMPTQADGKPAWDEAVPADEARVLRPVGTHNVFRQADVEVLVKAPTTTLADMQMAFKTTATPQPATNINNMPAHLHNRTATSVGQNMAGHLDYPPANAGVIVNECAQVRHCVTNQQTTEEPRWYATIGIAAYTEDPEETAKMWSKEHPGYNEKQTLNKLKQWKSATTGPTTCAKMEAFDPKLCSKCKFKGKITTPASLGVQHEEVQVAIDVPYQEVAEIKMPRGFKRTSKGMMKTEDGTDIEAIPFDIYPIGYGYDSDLGYEVVRYTWKRPHVGWLELFFRQSYLTGGSSKEFSTAMADQGIVLKTKNQTDLAQMLLRTYMDNLREIRSTSDNHNSMGWKDDGKKFLIGEELTSISPAGRLETQTIRGSSTLHDAIGKSFKKKGYLQGQVDFTEVIKKADMQGHGLAMLVSMASPLYELAGLGGSVINFWGETGAGKTLALLMAMSVWGHPKDNLANAKDTQFSIFSRMAAHHNIAVTIDEINLIDPYMMAELLYWASMGKERARLASDGSMKPQRPWWLPTITSSNNAVTPTIPQQGLKSDAQLTRLLDFELPMHRLFKASTAGGLLMYKGVHEHYGHIGEEVVKLLLAYGPDVLRKKIEDHRAAFASKYGFQFEGSERFRETTIVTADLIGEIAQAAGIIKFDHTECIKWAVAQMPRIREQAEESSVSNTDMLVDYLNEFAGSAVTAYHNIQDNSCEVDESELRPGPIRIRFQMFRPDRNTPINDGVVLIASRHLREWMVSKGGDPTRLKRELKDRGLLRTPSSKKFNLSKGTSVRTGQTNVIGVSLNCPEFSEVIKTKEAKHDVMVLKQLDIIQGGEI